MKRKFGKKAMVMVVAISLFSAFMASQVFAWGSATHAYIDDHLGRKGPVRNLNEIYGGMAPDVFNYLFSNPDWLEYLYYQTHYDNNILVWKKAGTLLEKAVAYGFVSHNGMTGADATAHGHYAYDDPDAWVIAKAVEMANSVEIYPILKEFDMVEMIDGKEVIDRAGYELCHTFVESAVDLLLAQHDRSLGGKISAAALSRTSEFPKLLVKAYANLFNKKFGLDLQTAATVIRTAENEFRKNLVSYGFALMQEPEVARELIADQLAALAPAFLGSFGVPIPEGKDLSALSVLFLEFAIKLCEIGYLDEVEFTINFVSNNLSQMGISY